MIERTDNKFGLLGDLNVLRGKVERNVRLAAGTLHNLRQAAETGEIFSIPTKELVRLLTEAKDALDQVTN